MSVDIVTAIAIHATAVGMKGSSKIIREATGHRDERIYIRAEKLQINIMTTLIFQFPVN